MSEAQLRTIDFLGIGIDNAAAALHSYKEPVMKRPSTHSCLSKITPHMLQQVLSQSQSHRCFSNPGISQTEESEDIKTTMAFLQQHDTGFQSNIKEDYTFDQQSEFSEAADAIHLQPSPPTKPSSAPLLIFYNGAMNIYRDVSPEKVSRILKRSDTEILFYFQQTIDSLIDEQAEAIIMLVSSNTNPLQHNYLVSDQGTAFTTLSSISNRLYLSAGTRTSGFAHSHGLDITPHIKLPIRMKLSVQRFLQKRKDRVNGLFPYTTSQKSRVWVDRAKRETTFPSKTA